MKNETFDDKELDNITLDGYINDDYFKRDCASSEGNSGKIKKFNSSGKRENRLPFIIGIIALCVQVVLSVILIIFVTVLGILPMLYYVCLIIILALLAFLVLAAVLYSKKVIRWIGAVFSIILCIILCVVNYYVIFANSILDDLTTSENDKVTYNVAVLATDPAETLEDAADYTFGTQSNFQSSQLDTVLGDIEDTLGSGIETKDYTSAISQAQALYDGEVGAIIYANAFTTTIEETHPTFSDDIKIIYTVSVDASSADEVESSDIQVTEDCFVVFISGEDQYGTVSTASRSDVDLLLCVNPNNKSILLVSVPRDYYVPISGISGTDRDKLTHAGIYGMDVLVNTVEDTFSIDIDYYLKFNFSAFVQVIDLIGGVSIYNDQEFTSYRGRYYPQGQLEMDGEYALEFVRERYAFSDGDFRRGQNQMLMIQTVVDKLCSLSNLTVFTDVADAVQENCLTNIPKKTITSLINLQLDYAGSWDIYQTQALGESMYQPSYAMGGMELSIIMPYAESIEYVGGLINKFVSGEEITIEEQDEYSMSYVITPIGEDSGSSDEGGEDEGSDWQEENADTYYEETQAQESAYEETVYEEPVYEEPVYEETAAETEYEEPAVETGEYSENTEAETQAQTETSYEDTEADSSGTGSGDAASDGAEGSGEN